MDVAAFQKRLASFDEFDVLSSVVRNAPRRLPACDIKIRTERKNKKNKNR